MAYKFGRFLNTLLRTIFRNEQSLPNRLSRTSKRISLKRKYSIFFAAFATLKFRAK